MFEHLNVRVRKEGAEDDHVGVSIHLGRENRPVRYGGLVEAELDGDVGVQLRTGEPGGGTTIVLRAGEVRLTLDPAGFRDLLRRGA